MIEFRVARGCRPTGRLLAQLLREKGIRLAPEGMRGNAVVSYGVRYTGILPCLNANAGARNKLEELQTFHASGVKAPQVYRFNGFRMVNGRGQEVIERDLQFPLFGRQTLHREGKDIMPALQMEDIKLRMAAGASFFTGYIPRETEYRVWIYRKRHGATYEKVMRYPEKYKYFGCSYRNGFAFELCSDRPGSTRPIPRDAVAVASDAVASLGLDFGAVDVLKGKDGGYYALEVNTAPGVEGARQSINFLADKIANWARLGYPRRNGDPRNQEA